MEDDDRYARISKSLTAILALFGLWIGIAPFILPGAEFELVHVLLGGTVTVIATGYLIQLHRRPETKLASLWFVLVLGVLLLTGTLIAHTPGTVFFWSTVVTASLTILFALIVIFWGSRFLASTGEKTTIFEK